MRRTKINLSALWKGTSSDAKNCFRCVSETIQKINKKLKTMQNEKSLCPTPKKIYLFVAEIC